MGIIAGKSTLGRMAAAGIAACALLASSLGPALAAPTAADPTPTAVTGAQQRAARQADSRLEQLYDREQKVLAQEQTRLGKANEAVTKAQARIDALKANGQDTSKFEAALAAFKAAMGDAQKDYDAAKAALDVHDGFNPGGQVKDAAAARNTVRTAGDAERQFHETMKRATSDLRTALQPILLSLRYEAERKRLAAEQKTLDRANTLVTRAQQRIDTLNGEGKNTKKLSDALAAFKNSLASAQSSHDSAKQVLDAHSGFDGSGNVVDVAQAKTTVQSAQADLKQFQTTMKQAVSDLQKTLKEYARGNSGQ